LALLEDYHELRDKVEKMGLYRPNFTFFALIAAHVVFFDLLGWWTMKTFGTGWLPYVIASVLLATAQVISSDGPCCCNSLSLSLHFNSHFPGEPGLAGVY